jgi:hypothetical protein
MITYHYRRVEKYFQITNYIPKQNLDVEKQRIFIGFWFLRIDSPATVNIELLEAFFNYDFVPISMSTVLVTFSIK